MVDHHVDRPGVEALQGVELTGTNRSDILNYAYRNHGWHLEVLLCTALGPSGFRRLGTRFSHPRLAGATARHRGWGSKFLASIAAGTHPFPSRTRQLSPPAPMIVGPQGPSKVGRRQISRDDEPAAAMPRALVVLRRFVGCAVKRIKLTLTLADKGQTVPRFPLHKAGRKDACSVPRAFSCRDRHCGMRGAEASHRRIRLRHRSRAFLLDPHPNRSRSRAPDISCSSRCPRCSPAAET